MAALEWIFGLLGAAVSWLSAEMHKINTDAPWIIPGLIAAWFVHSYFEDVKKRLSQIEEDLRRLSGRR